MVTMAGDLRRNARYTPRPELQAKLQAAARQLEATAFAQTGKTNPMIGRLLDTFA
jgi:hypothetical protein